MFRTHVERGLLAGAGAGLGYGLFVALVGNPLVGLVEGLAGHHGAAGGDAVSGTVAAGVGVAGGVLWGLLLGAVVFGALYYVLEPVLPGAGATRRLALAAAGFLTVSGAPWLVLPPQPAGVAADLPTLTRQLWYLGMVGAGAGVCVLAGLAYRRLAGRHVAVVLAGSLAPLALLAVPVALAPAPASPTAAGLSAEAVATFRGFVLLGQAGLWVALAGLHTWLGGTAPTRRADATPTTAD